jgi:hypothetical protein
MRFCATLLIVFAISGVARAVAPPQQPPPPIVPSPPSTTPPTTTGPGGGPTPPPTPEPATLTIALVSAAAIGSVRLLRRKR